MGKILLTKFGKIENSFYICLMNLEELCEIKTNFPEADFWLVRKGDEKTVGKPTREFSPEHIGIKVVETDVLLPEYLFYVMEYVQPKIMKYGSTKLKNIRTEDIKSLPLAQE